VLSKQPWVSAALRRHKRQRLRRAPWRDRRLSHSVALRIYALDL